MPEPQAGGPRADAAPAAPPYENPIVAEVRAIREAQFAAAGYDRAEYVRQLREVQATSGHPVISLRPRPAHDSAA